MKNYAVIFLLVAIIAVGGGVYYLQDSKPMNKPANQKSPAVTNTVAAATIIAQGDNFTYENYSEQRFNELKGNEKFAVFVHSKSCGTCAKDNQQIINEAKQFNGGTILRMEFDEAPTEFLQEHGVTSYHTYVLFDDEGKATTVPGARIDNVRAAIE